MNKSKQIHEKFGKKLFLSKNEWEKLGKYHQRFNKIIKNIHIEFVTFFLCKKITAILL